MRWTPIIVRNLLLGCETFNELREGAPGIPRTLLSAAAAAAGAATASSSAAGRRYLARRRRGRASTSDVVHALGTWGARWLEVAPEHFDSHLVLWSLCRLADPASIPDPRLVIRFDLSDEHARRRFWVVLAPPEAEVCVRPPGVRRGRGRRTSSEWLAKWHMGRISLGEAMHEGLNGGPGAGRTSSRRSPRSGSAASRTSNLKGPGPSRPGKQQLALALVAGQRRGALELGARLVDAAELGEQVAADAGQQVVVVQRGLVDAARRRARAPACRPERHAEATARLSSTTGDGVSCASASYSAAIRTQSVSAAVRARAWQAAIAACRPYGPRPRAPRRVRSARGRGGSAGGPSGGGPGRAAGSARRRGPVAGARARRLDLHQRDQPVHLGLVAAPARRGCGRAAARPRTARGASSRRRRVAA